MTLHTLIVKKRKKPERKKARKKERKKERRKRERKKLKVGCLSMRQKINLNF